MDNAQNTVAPMREAAPAHAKMEHFTPAAGVCTKEIDFVVEDGSIDYVKFCGGSCEGNLKAIAAMVEGMHVDFVIDKFEGITCGSKCTSCMDQFSHALQEYKDSHK